ncbi:MAG: YggS family pyridoxal phosphate-dependent enzyme [Alphaproteobacteria bacterium]
MNDLETDFAGRLADLTRRIETARAEAPRPASKITLVAVSKKQPLARVRAALSAGQRVFGENRVQEAQGKWPAARAEYPDIRLHLVGPLQTNKVRDAVALFDVIETVDRPKLAAALAKEMARAGRRPDCLVQVNTGAEPQKAGVPPAEADAFIAACRDTHGLPVAGLMCIPPAADEPAPHFAFLADMAARHGLGVLSMGMSADFEIAVRFGATHVRIGTALFGPRDD